MKKIQIPFFLCCLLFCGPLSLQAQSNTVASGGEATGTGGTVSYTVGQIDYSTLTGTGGSANEGVQQPYVISDVGVETLVDPGFSASIFPNPTTENLILKISPKYPEGLSYSLYDMNGKLLLQQPLNQQQTNIAMKDLPSQRIS